MNNKNNARCAADFGEEQHNGRDQSPRKETFMNDCNAQFNYSEEQRERAHEKLEDFRGWYRDNMRAWLIAGQFVLTRAREGKQVGGQMFVEYIRAHDVADRHGKPCRVNNDWAPLISRKLAHDFPEIAEHIERRFCAYDELGIDWSAPEWE